MSKRGRPTEYSNGAEKQKAYRERKKQRDSELAALRKYEWENSLEGLAEKVDILSKKYDDVQSAFPYRDADAVPSWSRDVQHALDEWWSAHSNWYKAWKAKE